jgi:hypothetical protein
MTLGISMKLCFILPGTEYTPYFLMTWTDLIMKCAQRGHQVMVSQQATRAECFKTCTEEFDAYMCIDPEAVFKPEDVLQLLESPHDATGVIMMSDSLNELTCGRTMESMIHEHENRYFEVEKLQPSFVLLQKIPEGWNYVDPIPAHIDTKIRVGNRVTVVV